MFNYIRKYLAYRRKPFYEVMGKEPINLFVHVLRQKHKGSQYPRYLDIIIIPFLYDTGGTKYIELKSSIWQKILRGKNYLPISNELNLLLNEESLMTKMVKNNKTITDGLTLFLEEEKVEEIKELSDRRNMHEE